ncbi:unannotated protein [freshwater metagenome]|uniref:Unannotated protein n=1 Tax=freshwater metagenome TaxID=449393 RepID=A0A6J6SPA1_9ZZZZ
MVALDEALHQFDHLGDVTGRAGLIGRGQASEYLVGTTERPLIAHREAPVGDVLVTRIVDDLVVDIGDIANECHVVSARHEPAAKDIEGDTAPDMTDMGRGLDRRTAQVDADLARGNGNELANSSRCGVIQG